MNPVEAARIAKEAYSAIPDYGTEDSSARVVVSGLSKADPYACDWSIPGTNNLSCFLSDVDALIHDAGLFGMVHRGIWMPFFDLFQRTQRMKCGADNIIGHSEGAAGALYLAGMLCAFGHAPQAVYAFEPPHTSIDDKLRKLLTDARVKVYIFHHGRDMVPMVPMPIPLEPWQHAADVIHFGKSSSILPNIKDHEIDGIIADLAAESAQQEQAT